MTKKYIWLMLLCFGLMAWGNIASAESGIDWENAHMMVEFSAENTAVPTLSCFGYSDRSAEAGVCNAYAGSYEGCVWEYLDELGYSDENSSPDITDCFQQAGDYQITIQLIDFAGNSTPPIVDDFVVKAGPPDATASMLTPAADCSDLSLGATGGAAGTTDNVCTVTLDVRDQFGNPVTQISGQTATVYSEADFANDANLGDLNFRTGTKLAAQALSSSFIPSTSATALNFTLDEVDVSDPTIDDPVYNNINITAWAPSITLLDEFFGAKEPFAYDLKFTLPTVDESGDLDLGNTVVFEFDQYAPQLAFSPWVRTLLDITATPKRYLLDVDTPFQITRNLILPAVGGPNSPFDALLRVHDLDPTLEITGLNFNPTVEVVDSAVETIISVLRAAGDNVQTGGSIFFSSIASYDISDGSTYNIAYPSGSLGAGLPGDDNNGTEITTSLIGVSVEGKILGSRDAVVINDPNSFNGVQISEGNSLSDIRREVFENAIRVTRSLDVTDESGPALVAFDASWYNDTNVVYVVDEDVVITNSGSTLNMPSGQNTLVIQNGNLIIEDDLGYASNLDSFGFILINDSIEIGPATGNIFIKDDVSKVVGTYFAEGGIISIPESLIITDTGDVTISDSDNADETNQQQLIIEGTMLTHNTLGGGILQATSNTYITPWETLDAGTVGTKEQAQRYDLHYLRAYSPTYDTADPPNQTNTADCYPGGNSYGCYPNNAATVVRYDGKAVKLPPPGYEGASFLAR